MTAPRVKQIPCWRCGGQMKHYASAGYYNFFECPACKAEAAEAKDESMTADRVAPEKPESPDPAGRGTINGGHRSSGTYGNAEQ